MIMAFLIDPPFFPWFFDFCFLLYFGPPYLSVVISKKGASQAPFFLLTFS